MTEVCNYSELEKRRDGWGGGAVENPSGVFKIVKFTHISYFLHGIYYAKRWYQ